MKNKRGKTPADEKNSVSPKKKAMLFLIVVAVLVLILALLNLIDFDKLGKKIADQQAPEKTAVTTFAPNHFVTPDYEEEIGDDKKYQELDRLVWLGDGSEETQIRGDGEAEGILAEFLVSYFDALKSGDLNALSECYADAYLKENPLPNEMTPQKVYNIHVKILSEKEMTGKDTGKVLYRTDFSYCIRKNNGTFRRDIRSDESRAQIYEIVKDGKNCTIEGVYEYRTGTKTPQKTGGKYMMTFVWIGVVLLAAVVEMLTLKMVAVWLMPAGIVSLVLSLFKVSIRWQIGVFAALTLLLLLLSRTLLKKYFKKQSEKAAGSIVGTAAVVTEKIDASGTGKVRVNGKIYSAVMINAGIANVGDVLKIDHLEGETLCCEPAPTRSDRKKEEKNDENE